MTNLLIGLLKAWRLLVSPWYGNVCRYYPSCSAYALRAVEFHGAWKGSRLAARRLLSCHPWSPGGYDPVRGTPEFDEEMREQRRAASTMGADTVRHVPPGHAQDPQSRNQGEGNIKHADIRQGEKVTVAQERRGR